MADWCAATQPVTPPGMHGLMVVMKYFTMRRLCLIIIIIIIIIIKTLSSS